MVLQRMEELAFQGINASVRKHGINRLGVYLFRHALMDGADDALIEAQDALEVRKVA